MASFPDVAHLAAADEHDVLRHWEGLGYYRRARQLHRAARQMVDEHAGSFPDEFEAVRRLAGIGRYTAGAIMSIAFDRPAPILEANTIRLYSRLMGFAGDTASAAGQTLLWQFAEHLLPRRGAGTLNQALMELGSQVCTPRSPRCDDCPVAELCAARRLGAQEQIPRARPKPKFEAVSEAAVVVRRGERVLLRRHPFGERWAGLWDFPRFELGRVPADSVPADSADRRQIGVALTAGVERLCGVRIEPGAHLATIKHGVTRFRITLECYLARYVSGFRPIVSGAEHRWGPPAELSDFALSTTGRKIARLLSGSRGS